MNNPTTHYSSVMPYLAVHNAKDAIAFYQKAFNATELFRLSDPESGKIGHAELLINDSTIMLSDEYPTFSKSPQTIGGTAVTFVLMVDDVDASVAHASNAGAIVVRPPKDEFYGYRSAMIRDPFGHEWMLQKEIEKVPAEEMQSRWREMLKES
jgi:PhnB protein